MSLKISEKNSLFFSYLLPELKGIGGIQAKKNVFVHFDICYSPKWGHMFLNYQNFSLYERLNEGRLLKYGKNCTFEK